MLKLRLLLIPLLLLMSACASSRQPLGNPEFPYPPSRPPAVGDILHLPTGVYVTETQMLRAVTDHRLVYVGETHDNPASHRLEQTVLRGMADRWPGELALGMEMFTPAQQPALDRWVAGELDEKGFLKESGWYAGWKMDFDYYRDLLLFARERKIPVIGLNAEKTMVKAVGAGEELSPEQQAELPPMDLEDPYQKALVAAIFGGHAHGEGDLSRFLRVQTLWDETMAENIARYLQEREKMRMVVVAGGNHIRHGFGIPRRVFRRLPASYVLVGSDEIEIPADKQDRLMDVEMPEFPLPPYHFLAYTRYEDLGKEEVRLGILLDQQAEKKIMVEGVLPGSAAEQAGVLKGDRILALDGAPVTESFDVIYAVKQKRPGEKATLLVDRGGKEIGLEITFRSPREEKPHGK